jgi:hypothetical protein
LEKRVEQVLPGSKGVGNAGKRWGDSGERWPKKKGRWTKLKCDVYTYGNITVNFISLHNYFVLIIVVFKRCLHEPKQRKPEFQFIKKFLN